MKIIGSSLALKPHFCNLAMKAAALLYLLSVAAAAPAAKVNVSIYEESLCPACSK